MDEKLILVVEDEYTAKSELRKNLENNDFYVTSVAEGDRGILEKLLSQKPHILVIGSGTEDEGERIDLLKTIKNEEQLKDCEIFVFAERIEIPLLKKLRELQIKNYLTIDDNMPAQLAEQMRRFFKGWDDTHVLDLTMINGILGEEMTDGKPSYHTEAHPIITDVLSVEPEEDTDFEIGEKLMDSGNYEQALEPMRKAAKVKQFREKALVAVGICLRKLKKYKEAVETLQTGAKETEALSGKTHFRYQLGVTLEEVGKHKEALRFFSAVEKADPSYHDIASRIIEAKERLQGK